MSDPIQATDILGMSDEEFLNQMPTLNREPASPETPPTDPVDPPVETPAEVIPSGSNPEEPPVIENTPTPVELEVEANGNKVESKSGNVTPELTPNQDAKANQSNPNPTNPPAGDKGAETDPAAVTPGTAVNYETEYKRLMAPIKANGKMIELKSPEELIQLAQMGANYTRKMQDIAPHRKVLLMLQNNGLLDEGKLSYLIDLDKKNPDAINKLIQDSGINPLDIDTESAPTYQATSHAVSDAEANFQAVLSDLGAHEAGQKTLHAVHTGWDDASKNQLLQDPSVLTLIHEQREAGIYDRITTEIERRRTLGQIAAGTPFLKAYELVGNDMQAKGGFNDLIQPAAPTQPVPAVPVATRVVAPKPQASNSDQANAAAATRTTARKAAAIVNPLAMSDDEFMKQMSNRL